MAGADGTGESGAGAAVRLDAGLQGPGTSKCWHRLFQPDLCESGSGEADFGVVHFLCRFSQRESLGTLDITSETAIGPLSREIGQCSSVGEQSKTKPRPESLLVSPSREHFPQREACAASCKDTWSFAASWLTTASP